MHASSISYKKYIDDYKIHECTYVTQIQRNSSQVGYA